MATARRPLALLGARLLDPASGRDESGGLLAIDGRIAEVGPTVRGNSLPEGCEILRCEGHCLAPGLIDMRVQLREPGEEHMETIASGDRGDHGGTRDGPRLTRSTKTAVAMILGRASSKDGR